MAEFQNTIDLLGDEVVAASIIDKTITEFNDDGLTNVGAHAFFQCTALTSVNLPNATSIGMNAPAEAERTLRLTFTTTTLMLCVAFVNTKERQRLWLP